TDNEFGLGVQMRVLPRTWAFLRYHYKIQDFYSHRLNTTSANDASNKQNRVNMGLIWDGGGKLGGELNFGWQWVDFDNDVDPSGAPYDNQNTWIAGTSLDYRATATTLLTLNIARLIRPTGADKREYYDDTQAGINLTQDLPYKFSAQAGFVYSRNDYNTLNDQGTEDRKDNNYNANVGVTYQIQRWLNTGIAYRYLRKDSNSISQSFTDHQVILSVGAAY
ncbi:MAG: outer membrane beta-barrel protein, partial [Desulfobacteraceae bacterium]